MTGRSASLVRGWVDLYTRGLPAELRDGRRDEIAGDLWSQFEEAALIGRSERATANEILVRLVAGIPADISWRVAHGGEKPVEARQSDDTTGTVGLGWAAIVAGFGTTGLLLRYGEVLTSDILIWTGLVAYVALAVVLVGLALGFQDRLGRRAFVAASVGALCAVFAGVGLWPLMFALPFCSAPLLWDLASERILGRWAAWSHAITAGAVIVIFIGFALGGLQYQIPTLGALAFSIWFAYPLTWVLIGMSLIRRPSLRSVPRSPHKDAGYGVASAEG